MKNEKELCEYYPQCVEDKVCYNPPRVLDGKCKTYNKEIKIYSKKRKRLRRI